MAKLVYEMNQSLDGYVDHDQFAPTLDLFCHFINRTAAVTGMIYGRRMYEIMRYWDEDQPGWETHEHAYAAAWRSKPKWVVSRSLQSVDPNATLIADDVGPAIRKLKAEHSGEIEVAGPNLAHTLAASGLIDEYRIYLHPVVLGSGTPFFAGPRPRLHLLAADPITTDILRLTYTPT